MTDINRISIHSPATGISTELAPVSPYVGKDIRIDCSLYVAIVSLLSLGSKVTFRHRMKSAYTGGTDGAWTTIKKFTDEDMGIEGSYVASLSGLDGRFEYDLFVDDDDYESGDGDIVVQLIGA